MVKVSLGAEPSENILQHWENYSKDQILTHRGPAYNFLTRIRGFCKKYHSVFLCIISEVCSKMTLTVIHNYETQIFFHWKEQFCKTLYTVCKQFVSQRCSRMWRPNVPEGAPVNIWGLTFFRGTIAGGKADPVAETMQQVVTNVPLSTLVTLFNYLCDLRGNFFWAFEPYLLHPNWTPSSKCRYLCSISNKFWKNFCTLCRLKDVVWHKLQGSVSRRFISGCRFLKS